MEFAMFPQFILRKIAYDRQKQLHWNILMTNLMMGILLCSFSHQRNYVDIIPGVCLFHIWFSIPCPGCGITTSLLEIAGGNINGAWDANPAGVFVFFLIWLQVPLRIVVLVNDKSTYYATLVSQMCSRIIVLGLITVWIKRLLDLLIA